MIYAVRLYTVDSASVSVFAAAFRRGGLWADLARLLPGHIHTDLLRNPSNSSKFMSIEFWTSIQALVAARRSPEVRSFAGWLNRQCIDCEGLGMFVFPESTSDEATRKACSGQDEPACQSTEFADAVI